MTDILETLTDPAISFCRGGAHWERTFKSRDPRCRDQVPFAVLINGDWF